MRKHYLTITIAALAFLAVMIQFYRHIEWSETHADQSNDQTQKYVEPKPKKTPMPATTKLHVKPLVTLKGHTDSVSCVRFSANGELLASASVDRSVRTWEMKSLQGKRVFQCSCPMHDVAFSPDGKWLAATASTGGAIVWSMPGGGVQWSTLKKYDGPGTGGNAPVAFSPNSKILVYSEMTRVGEGIRESVAVVEPATGKNLKRLFMQYDISGTTADFVFSPDGETLAAGWIETGGIEFWNTTTWQSLRTLDRGTPGPETWGIVLSPDGKTLATGEGRGSYGKTVKLWDFTTNELQATLEHDETVFCIAFSPDAKLFASTSSSASIKIWQFKTLAELTKIPVPVSEGDHGAYDIAFSPTQNLLAAACSDGMVRLWTWETEAIGEGE